jgi:hypothetical protein
VGVRSLSGERGPQRRSLGLAARARPGSLGRVKGPRVEREQSLEGQNDQESSGSRVEATRLEGTVSRGEESPEVGEAGGTE